MDSVLRGWVVYAFLLIIFRLAGKRTLSDSTTFDLVLLLIISETTQQAMVGHDHSITNAFLLIMTLVGTSILLSVLKERFLLVDRWLEGAPLILVENGTVHRHRMRRARVNEEDLRAAARITHGLERLDQIKFAIVECNGTISIIPRS